MENTEARILGGIALGTKEMFTITEIGRDVTKHKPMADGMLRIPVKEGRRKTAMVYVKDLAEATSMLKQDWCVEWVEIMAGAQDDGTGKYVGGTPTGRWEVTTTWAEYERRQGLAVDNRTDVMVAKKLMGFQRDLLLAKTAVAQMDAKTAADIMADIIKA